MKKLFALTLAALLALSVFAGCSLNADSNTQDVPAATNASDVDRDAIVITVGDETVTMGEYMDLFDTYASYYTSFGYDIYSDEAALSQFQDFIIDLLAEEKILAYQAKKAGFETLTDDKLAEIETKVTDELEYLMSTYREQAQTEAETDSSINVEARAKELLEAETEYYTGSSMNYDEFVEWVRNFYMDTAISDLFREETLKGVSVDEAALQTWYDETLAEQKETYTANGGAYKADAESFDKFEGAPALYVPEGYSRVLHILITPDGEPGEEYVTKTAEMDALAAEYGELAFNAAIDGTDSARLAEIIAEYKALQKEVAALDATRMAPALEKANEAYAKLEEGADFATIMAEYTEDADILSFERIAEKGLLISNKYESEMDWSKEVKTAFSTLRLGEYSKVIQDETGCHILYYLADETPGVVAFDAVKEAATALLLLDLQEQEWAAMLETWKNDGSVVINEELVHAYDGSVG